MMGRNIIVYCFAVATLFSISTSPPAFAGELAKDTQRHVDKFAQRINHIAGQTAAQLRRTAQLLRKQIMAPMEKHDQRVRKAGVQPCSLEIASAPSEAEKQKHKTPQQLDWHIGLDSHGKPTEHKIAAFAQHERDHQIDTSDEEIPVRVSQGFWELPLLRELKAGDIVSLLLAQRNYDKIQTFNFDTLPLKQSLSKWFHSNSVELARRLKRIDGLTRDVATNVHVPTKPIAGRSEKKSLAQADILIAMQIKDQRSLVNALRYKLLDVVDELKLSRAVVAQANSEIEANGLEDSEYYDYGDGGRPRLKLLLGADSQDKLMTQARLDIYAKRYTVSEPFRKEFERMNQMSGTHDKNTTFDVPRKWPNVARFLTKIPVLGNMRFVRAMDPEVDLLADMLVRKPDLWQLVNPGGLDKLVKARAQYENDVVKFISDALKPKSAGEDPSAPPPTRPEPEPIGT